MEVLLNRCRNSYKTFDMEPWPLMNVCGINLSSGGLERTSFCIIDTLVSFCLQNTWTIYFIIVFNIWMVYDDDNVGGWVTVAFSASVKNRGTDMSGFLCLCHEVSEALCFWVVRPSVCPFVRSFIRPLHPMSAPNYSYTAWQISFIFSQRGSWDGAN